MNDDVKAAVAEIRAWYWDSEGWAVVDTILAHLDGEAERTRKAVGAEREAVVAMRKERDELRARIISACPSPDESGRIHAGGRVVCGQCHDSEVTSLRARVKELEAVLEEVAAGPSLPAAATRGERTHAREQWWLARREKARAALEDGSR